MTPPSTTPTTFAPTATTAPESWATRRGLAPWLPARCRCGPRADLAFVLVVARNGSLQVRLRCAACGTTGERSVPHVHVHRADRVTIAKDNRPRRGLRCESCDALAVPIIPDCAPGTIAGACPRCLILTDA